MGLILDSTAIVAAERQGLSARQMLERLALQTGDQEIAISVITVLKLAHGAARANSPERLMIRQQFLDELTMGVPVHPVTLPVALHAGRIDGESPARGIRIPLSDLLIGVTALELGYAVGTANLRHFSLIPNLPLLPL